MRLSRFTFADVCGADSAKCIGVIPIFAGEAGNKLHATVEIKSLPRLANAFQFTGPWSFIEYNFYVLVVPMNLVTGIYGMANATGTANIAGMGIPRPPTEALHWDTLFRRLVFEFGSDGNEYYGANPDGNPTAGSAYTYDATRNAWVTKTGFRDGQEDSSETATTTTLGAQEVSDEPVEFMGPMGLQRLYAKETFLSAQQTMGAAKASQQPFASIFDGFTSITDVVYADRFELNLPLTANEESIVLMGLVRYEQKTTKTGIAENASDFLASYKDGGTLGYDTADSIADPTLAQARGAQNEGLNLLHSGMRERVQWNIQNGTSPMADFVRSALFGGDHAVADNPASRGFFTAAQPFFVNNDIVCAMKGIVSVHSPYVWKAV